MRFNLLLGAMSLAAASSCSTGGGLDQVSGDFAHIQQIFNASCTTGESTCHGPHGTGGGLRLDAPESYANLVGQPSQELFTMNLVEPGDPSRSFLYHKVLGDMYTALPGCDATNQTCGVMMPMAGGTRLSDAEIESIRMWIAAGAPSADGSTAVDAAAD